MRYEYAGYWVVAVSGTRANDPYTEEEARKLFASSNTDDWFSVAAFKDDLPNTAIPEFTLEVLPHAEFIKVFFYDQHRSIRFIYGLRTTGDKLFLEYTTQYTYPDDSHYHERNESSVIESFRFEPGGTVQHRINDKSKPTIQVSDRRPVDVSSNWEPVPGFGQWGHLARFDR